MGLIVKVPKLVTYFFCTSIFEWSVIECKSKSRHHKNMLSKEIGIHTQNLLTVYSLEHIVVSLGHPKSKLSKAQFLLYLKEKLLLVFQDYINMVALFSSFHN